MPPKSKAAKALTKSELFSELAAKSGLKKTEIQAVFEALCSVIQSELRSKGVVPAIPGLLKIKKVDKKATPSRAGRNPFTGEAITIKAKPARKGVRVTALKTLKEMV